MTGLWWRGKRDRRWDDNWRFVPGWTLENLRSARSLVGASVTYPIPLGFCPRTFAAGTIEMADARYKLPPMPTGADGITFSFALYQRIQVAEGTWDEGPRWRVWLMPNVFYEEQRLERLVQR